MNDSNKQTITLVKFTAGWCYPCKALEPTLKEFAAKHPEVTIEKVNIDLAKNAKRCDEERVQSIPTLIMYVNGKKVWRVSEVVGLKRLESALIKAKDIAFHTTPDHKEDGRA